MPRLRTGFVAAAVFASILVVRCSGQISKSPIEKPTALAGATIYLSPTQDPIRNGVILIQDGKIAAVGSRASLKVPSGAKVLDCSGMFITAGFWNSHVHFFQRKWANAAEIPAAELTRQMQDMLTQYGFTSVFDLGSPPENTLRIRERIESGEIPGPRIRMTRGALGLPGAVPSDQVLNVLGTILSPNRPEVSDAPGAAATARRLLDEGADGIKLHSLPDESIIRAAVGAAHKSGKLVFAHPSTGQAGLLAAIRGGVDILAHTTPWLTEWNGAILSEMKERKIAVIPTLQIWKYLRRHDRLSVQERTTKAAAGQLRAWTASGGTVLFGTDAGAVEYDPGDEYALMAEAGMSFRQILASLTSAPADRFGESARLGRIATGFQADLVVLKDDPSRSIRAFTKVQYTLRDGKIIYRADR